MTEKDPTKREVPINPPVHSSKELWYTMNYQSSIQGGLGSGATPEITLTEQNDNKHPSEVDRIKKATEALKK
jgi:hypothetical protein